MSTNMNVTVGPGDACTYLGSMEPPEWKADNYTGAACSVPNCEDNRAAIEKCCVGRGVTSFNHTVTVPNATINAEYLTCAVAGSAATYDSFGEYNASDPYQAYQDCLVRAGAARLACNNPSSQISGCVNGDYGITTPAGIGGGHFQTICAVNTNNENATGALTSCCVAANGTIRAETNGCEMSCSGEYSVASCLSDANRRHIAGGSFPTICNNYTNNRNGGTSGAGRARETGRVTVAGVLVLSLAFLAFL